MRARYALFGRMVGSRVNIGLHKRTVVRDKLLKNQVSFSFIIGFL